MGEMADYLIEQGEDAWFAHLAGQCGEFGPCQYCEEEDAKPKRKRRKKKNLTLSSPRKEK